jgi:hypothetical protein
MMAPRPQSPAGPARPAPVSPMAPQQNKGDKYQGLFPFDTRGQAIARGQE